MKIIRQAPNPSGAYPSPQSWSSPIIPEGMALWPDTLDTADFYEYNGFVTLTIEQVDGVDTVTACTPNIEAWEAWKASLPEPGDSEQPEPTMWDQMAAAIQEGVNEV